MNSFQRKVLLSNLLNFALTVLIIVMIVTWILLAIGCGGAGTPGNAQPQTLPYYCQVFVATARACIAQHEDYERAELNQTLQSTIDMWRAQQRNGTSDADLNYSCEQATGWGTDLAYCPEGS